MSKLVCVMLLLSFAASMEGTPRVRRLAGGIDAENGQFPYMAAIKYDNKLICGGAIISPNKILTAANCFWCESKPLEECVKSLTVQTGSVDLSKGGNLHRVKNIKIADDFVVGKFANDLAIVTLDSEIKFSENEKVASLPDRDVVDNEVAISSGWGIKSENSNTGNVLASLNEKTISASRCRELLSKNVDTNDFCAIAADGNNNSGLCNGDSGNPLVLDGKVIGVSSWGIGCGSGFPDVFANVYRHVKFIKSQL